MTVRFSILLAIALCAGTVRASARTVPGCDTTGCVMAADSVSRTVPDMAAQLERSPQSRPDTLTAEAICPRRYAPFTFHSTPGRAVADVGVIIIGAGGCVIVAGGVVILGAYAFELALAPVILTGAILGAQQTAGRFSSGFENARHCGKILHHCGYGIAAAGVLTGIVGGTMIICENRLERRRLSLEATGCGAGLTFRF